MVHYADQLQVYKSDPAEAEKALKIGEYPPAEQLDIAEQAALMQVVSLMYNLEETLMKS
jgi:hypothetical protein